MTSIKPLVGLAGAAGSGKDAFAARLVEKHGYVRAAFADRLKSLSRHLDPIISWDKDGPLYLSYLEALYGTDEVKRRYPEVRRLWQQLGDGARNELSPGVWVDRLLEDIAPVLPEHPVVVTDVRYPNEVTELTLPWWPRGVVVRIVRPGLEPLAGELGRHSSETALNEVNLPEIRNDGTLEDLWRKVDMFAESVAAGEDSPWRFGNLDALGEGVA